MERARNVRPEAASRGRRLVLATLAVTFSLGTLAMPAAAADSGERPPRGLTMSQVEARYGAPADRSAAVGQPPITRWEYAGFVVYFENDRVIHAVVTGAPAPAQAPASNEGG